MDNKLMVTPNIYFRTINILFLALVAGQVVFALVLFFLNQTQEKVAFIITPEIHQTLIWVALALAVAGIAIGWLVFNAKLKSLQSMSNLTEKLKGYQSAMIVRFAFMEGPSLVALVFFYITGDYIFPGVSAFIIIAFLFNRPSKSQIIRHLQLHDDERLLLEDPEAFLYER
jgi:F0F1-type ATP synthase membrane subunit c/vacuolar-type H+-ATPase subunit K